MLNRIIRFSIKNKLIIGVFTLLLAAWGLWSATKLPIDAVPDITNNQVQIITLAPTLAGQEVEQFVTYPIEQSIANLPDLEEVRSISRFGLSVVTVVFDDAVDIYFARQLVDQRLKEAIDQIPEGIGTPELAPVSTGLGEVYQYVIHPKKGSEGKYTAMDLRTMQDWIVARQLLGTPGIAEVNSIGGFVKQYEVAVDPMRLKAMNVTMPELLTALEENNQNTGGAYIDKKPNAYFIRGIGLVTSLEDVGAIVVKTAGGVPVLVRDVATPRFGNAVRYGAMTRNGEGEVVGGIVMMLKGANSADVVGRVKERMETIKKSLPEDIIIEPFVDRTGLVGRAISTVEKNLIEGALIVIFVLVLFLGNFRAGLIVASAIPLAMLFALGMMNLFDVSANLMSLGAIDFGLIVDGAVIIVEATMHHLALRKGTERMTQAEMDDEVYESASKIRNSAAFGEIIILIVYIPILTLVGIEGKMFRPMAQTVGFAILGALILSLTYIPMMSALVLPKKISHKRTFSDKMMDFFQRLYTPALTRAIRAKYAVVAVAVGLMVLTVIAFMRMGGEFLPQLQEGDYAFQCILPQGSSLSQSIETSQQASRIIKSFPEVKQVVARTGAAEVPTDPMPPEATDMIIILKDKDEWTTTQSYTELSNMIEEKLEAIPGVFFEASQPIQLRFNELMTGVRQDVAIKIFGENLDTLAALAPRIGAIVQSVEGTSAPQVERTTGLPQITIQYDRTRIASYGLSITDVNDIVSTAFAGRAAGVVFENERKFDMVVRLDTAHRTSIEDVTELFIPLHDGTQVPLSQLATVNIKEGPAQISREDAKRRIVIGFNVKGRDVQSVVKDIQEKLASFRLPTGYYITYGGTFENLEQASARLRIAVPVALLLIFALLYFTFRSLKQATLIFTAIPMSAIGGVAALMVRGMPFSISAGVGFIALFGVAVLNGIVLVGTFNQLQKDGIGDVIDRVMLGTKERLRPVLMTAMVASLGFLPMAISSGAGAEVQKPLATVVIGGLITATILTLIVLPLLYILFEGRRKTGTSPVVAKVAALLLALAASTGAMAQAPAVGATRISFNAAYETALTNNLGLRSSDIAIRRASVSTGTFLSLPKTGVFFENEDLRPSDQRGILKIGLSQAVEWPGIYSARRRLLQQQAQSFTFSRQVQALELRRSLQTAYYTLWYFQSRQQLFERLDTLYSTLASAASLRVRTGESAGLDSIAARARSAEIRAQLANVQSDIAVQQSILQTLLNTDSLLLPDTGRLGKVEVPAGLGDVSEHPALRVQQQAINIAEADLKVTRLSVLPEFSGRFFSQRLYGLDNPFTGFSVSVGVPLFGLGSYRAKLRAASLERDYQASILGYQRLTLNAAARQAQREVEKARKLVEFYETTGLAQAEVILRAANLSYRAGEISFAELSQFLTQANDIQRNYLEVLNQYNQAAINLSFYYNQ